MAIPLFYHEGDLQNTGEILLNEIVTKHVVQVLRMKEGDRLQLTDGKGMSVNVFINNIEKKKCFVTIEKIEKHLPIKTQLHLCVAFTKNAARNEWLLEKVIELGVATITPVITKRTERQPSRSDRWKNIIISAMQQSQQYYLPELRMLLSLENIFTFYNDTPQKLIAHCMEDEKRNSLKAMMQPEKETVILIGPEGDFTKEEVGLCLGHGFMPVQLGNKRLRTETAAMAACAYFNMINHED